MSRLKPWRFALGWKGWREMINSERAAPYQIVEEGGFGLSVRIELLEGGRVGLAGEHRDAARRIILDMTEAEAMALAKGIWDRLGVRGQR
jgi:hypothetical protein